MAKKKRKNKKRVCAEKGCSNVAYARCLCRKHYTAFWRAKNKKGEKTKTPSSKGRRTPHLKESPYSEEELDQMYENLCSIFQEDSKCNLKDTKQAAGCWKEETDEEILSRYDDEIFDDYPQLKPHRKKSKAKSANK